MEVRGETSREARPEIGLLVEVANVAVAGRASWWTLQFELLAGKSTPNEPTLRRAVDWAVGQKWPDRAALREDNSLGYPALVERIMTAPDVRGCVR